MNYLREKVSGNKNRMKELNYNLDLTYICPRILAMSFPGEGLEKAYRNDINEVQILDYNKVACFMKEKHKNDFQIYNLSGRNYDYNKFMNKVYDFVWFNNSLALGRSSFSSIKFTFYALQTY